jgi:hypothetical protein
MSASVSFRRDAEPLDLDAWDGAEREPQSSSCETGCEWLWSRGSPLLLLDHTPDDAQARQVLDEYPWRFYPAHGDRYDAEAAMQATSRELRRPRKGPHEWNGARAGARNPNAKLTEAVVLDARKQRAAGVSVAAIARAHDVAWVTMSNAIKGRSWAAVECQAAPGDPALDTPAEL